MQVNEHDADRERENDANHTAGARTEGSGMRADMGDIAGNRTADGHRGANADEHARFVHLKDSNDLKVADGEPDIRGWDLQTTDGMTIGKVVDLIVDTSLMKVRYIEGSSNTTTVLHVTSE